MIKPNVYKRGVLGKWVCICSRQFMRDAENFIGSLIIKVALGMRMSIEPPRCEDLQQETTSTYLEKLKQVMQSYSPLFIVCVVPNSRSDVKRLQGANLSIPTKLAIQIICKIDGSPRTVPVPLSGLIVVEFEVAYATIPRTYRIYGVMASLNKP